MADRNLLFGILALQMDFITRDQLVAAMNAWVLDKARPLAQILHEHDALSAEHRQLLEALVLAHLKQHGGDPQQSLRAVDSPSSWVLALKKVADHDVQASLAFVSADHALEDPFATKTFVAGAPTSAGTRFRILRPHARGGLGEVFIAQDEELRREVALKEIQARHADSPHSRARFVQEAEVTGGLEHPGIVPVYGLGRYADGRPFYAMRFIKGGSLKDAIDRFHKLDGPRDPVERGVELRKLLRRFFDVCNAMEYAHSRGVLHRDLKPGNIMLGQYGETLIVDWGLAKTGVRGQGSGVSEDQPASAETPLHPSERSGSAPTVMGSAVGTPAYMSPEQASGRLDLLGPASDVYCLGATLYSLLTGQPAFSGTAEGDILSRVQRGDFPRPRRIQADIHPALEAICLKAMALRSDDRYATVAELGKDIEGWLNDQPVNAWPEPWTVRTRRWLGRHPTLASATATAILLVTLTAGGALWLIQRQSLQRQAQTAQVVNQAMGQANALRAQARDMTPGDAEQQEREAALWRDALAAADRVEQALDSGDANTETRQAAAEMLEDLRAQAGEADKDRRMLRRLEDALELSLELQDSDYVRPHGRDVVWGFAAAQAFADAFKEYGIDVAALAPEEAANRMRQRRILLQLTAALEHWYFVEPDAVAGHLLDLARLANADPLRNQARAAIASKDRAALKQVADADKAIDLPTSTLLLLTDVLHHEGLRAEGLDLIKRAQRKYPSDFWINAHVGIYLANGPASGWAEANRSYAAAIALRPKSFVAWSNLGMTLAGQGDLDAAQDAFRKSLELNPNFTMSHYQLAHVLLKKGMAHEALAGVEAALKKRPDSPMLLTALGTLLHKQGKRDEAIAACESALARSPRWFFAQELLATLLVEMGQSEKALALLNEAQRLQPQMLTFYLARWQIHRDQNDLDAAVKTGQEAVRAKPQSELAHNLLGIALQMQGRYAEAVTEFRATTRLAPREAVVHYNLGNALLDKKQYAEALDEFEAAIHWGADRAIYHYGMGVSLLRQRKYHDAAAAFARTIAIDPSDAFYHNGLARACHLNGEYERAASAAAEAIRIDPKDFDGHNQLANTWVARGRYAEAIPHYLEAVRLNPKDGVIRLNFGKALLRKGDFAQAITAIQQSVKLLDARHASRPEAEKELKECERLLALDKQVLAFLQRGEAPKESKRLLELADICRRYKQYHGTAAALYGRVFTPEADLTEELVGKHRYKAAYSSVLAAAGKGLDPYKPGLENKRQLRAQALEWLKAELQFCARQSQAVAAENPLPLIDLLARWETDEDLASIREPKALAALPDEEQAAWRELWDDAHLLVKVARAGVLQITFNGNLSANLRAVNYAVNLAAGKTYVIDMHSTVFDAHIQLRDDRDTLVAENDDVIPGNREARLVFTPKEDRAFRIVATSLHEGGQGAYTLTVRAIAGKAK